MTEHARGTFLMLHRGLMTRGAQELAIDIVPDSGTGGFAGIAGRLGLRIEEGVHHYDLVHTLPDA